MSNQAIGKCRFYANIGEYFHANKMLLSAGTLNNSLFSRPHKMSVWGDFDTFGFDQTTTVSNKTTGTIQIGSYSGGAHTGNRIAHFFRDNRFIAILNHNFYRAQAKFWLQTYYSGQGAYSSSRAMEEIVNGTISSNICSPGYDGFTICEILDGFDENHNSISIVLEATSGTTFAETPGAGCVILGTFWNVEAPDLQISSSRVFDKPKEYKSYNGRSFTNSKWNAPAFWDFAPPWGLKDVNTNATNPYLLRGRQGKRVYNLKWSFIDEKSLFGITSSDSIYTGSTPTSMGQYGYEDTDYTSTGTFERDSTLLDYESFNKFWTISAGMTIPFIFQPDANNTANDQFSICILKKGSLRIRRTSIKRYSLSMTIQEI